MNYLSKDFKRAHSGDFRDALGIAASDERSHLVVTGLDLAELGNALLATPANTYVLSLPAARDADEVLNGIAFWMMERNMLNQFSIYGPDRSRYNIGFYEIAKAAQTPRIVDEFYLEDYIFPDRHSCEASCLDDLMRMLDRDRLGLAMKKVLVEELDIEEREFAPQFWRRELRLCSHPDKKNDIAAVLHVKNSTPSFLPKSAAVA